MIIKKNLILLLLLPFLLISSASSQIIKSVSVDFTRVVTKEASEEVVKGNIYYQPSKGIVLKINEPIQQWMVLEQNTMLIYYQNERKAFRFKSENPFSLPFFQAFLGVDKDGFGLSEAGFKLFRNEMKGDTLFTYWKPPEQANKTLGNTIMGLEKDKLVLVEVQDTKGGELAKTTFSNHFQYGATFFPLEVVSIKYQENSSIVEKIVYANLQFNVTFPEEVVNFKIPADIEIREIEW